ncbi:hypothetical protein EON67_05260 [archaeon]|nr:MAG: hypothetical protein EON67_05260 [archaeon]
MRSSAQCTPARATTNPLAAIHTLRTLRTLTLLRVELVLRPWLRLLNPSKRRATPRSLVRNGRDGGAHGSVVQCTPSLSTSPDARPRRVRACGLRLCAIVCRGQVQGSNRALYGSLGAGSHQCHRVVYVPSCCRPRTTAPSPRAAQHRRLLDFFYLPPTRVHFPIACAANRAFAQLKVENYGLAIADATAAIEADASYLKGYYRRGSAYLALQKYKLAKADFRAVLRAKPGEKDAQVKCDECDKAIRRKAFEEAIAIEATLPITDRLKVDTLVVDASYEGPMLPDIPADGAAACAEECAANPTAVNAHGVSRQFVTELMAHFKAQKGLHKKFACQLLIRLSKVLGALPSLVPVTVPSDGSIINVCGDTHGQYYDTLNIFGTPRVAHGGRARAPFLNYVPRAVHGSTIFVRIYARAHVRVPRCREGGLAVSHQLVRVQWRLCGPRLLFC